ncbi:MAG TPA: hypothetical protein VH234_03180 [Candidatus Saccharimonadales bacterium]|jgi:hypothetical protein|nr:hypothetical protein [Candidatus Saccharimonadales bacterium]
MKKLLRILILSIVGAVLLNLPGYKVSAATFNPNDVIDDGIFDNAGSMSALQINNFLNNFSGSCISPNSGFQAIDPNSYSPSGGFGYGNFTTAGQVIYDAANAYGLNPQVLLVTLQKEQSLVTGGSGICNASNQNQYAAAAGYGCPDSGTKYSYSNVNLYERNGVMVTTAGSTCVNSASKAGFSQQVIRAAWLFKFGEQRSQGNINWEVVKGNWNNSDDPQTCYGGPMTQGTFKICPGGPSTFYDGYTTIDGTSVHMDNGATAALYWYTPHLSGNQSFDTVFDQWFGSTSYPEPLGSLLAVDNQTGQIYFVSLTNNTRYAVMSWSTLLAYNLNGYPIIPMDDSALQGYANGGVLKTLVWDSNTQSLFLVDHGTRYAWSQYCTQWGLDCLGNTPGDVTNLNNTYFDQGLTNGGSDQPLMQVNGQYYLMQNGSREPFATTADMRAAGYSPNQSVPIVQADLNATQPLGSLQISLPNFIDFNNSSMYYFDGQSYHTVPSWSVYQAWGNQAIIVPPSSSTDQSLPTSASTLSIWVEDTNNNYYLIDSGRKVNISADPANWYTSSFESLSANGLSGLPNSAEQHNIYSQGNAYQLQSHTLRYVPSPDDYYGLGINPGNTLNLNADSIATVPAGADVLRDGAPYTVLNGNALYIANNNASLYVPSVDMANDFGIDWGAIRSNLNPNVLSTGYPSAGTLTRWIKSGGSLGYVTSKTIVSIGSVAASQWGINTTSQAATSIDPGSLYGTNRITPLGQFVRNKATGGVYYGTGGASHYIASYNAFVNLGGTSAKIIDVSPDFFTAMPSGYTYDN